MKPKLKEIFLFYYPRHGKQKYQSIKNWPDGTVNLDFTAILFWFFRNDIFWDTPLNEDGKNHLEYHEMILFSHDQVID